MIRGHGLVHKIEQEDRANRHQLDSYGEGLGFGSITGISYVMMRSVAEPLIHCNGLV